MGSVETAVTIVLTGILVVVPVVALFMYHQRKMTELLHRNQTGVSEDLATRLDAIQNELAELKDRQNELILQRHDAVPHLSPKVEDRIQE